MPPARSRFIWYSGDVIRKPLPAGTAARWTSSPGAGTTSGVSTSTNSRLAKNSRVSSPGARVARRIGPSGTIPATRFSVARLTARSECGATPSTASGSPVSAFPAPSSSRA